MNSKQWIRKALSSCLMVAVLATSSMVAFAGGTNVSGELSVIGTGDNATVIVNGEAAKSGRTVFSTSTVTTPEFASATVNIGSIGEIELAPNSTALLTFTDKGISADLSAGQIKVLRSTQPVSVNTLSGTVALVAGGSVKAVQDDYKDKKTGVCIDADKDGKLECDNTAGGAIWWGFGGLLAGAAILAVWAAASSNDNTLGGGGIVISPIR